MRDGTSQERARALLAPAAVLALVLFAYPLTLGTPLLDPDEGLMASIAQEMVERGDWVTPRLFGEPFLDKPIFFVWARAVSLELFGMSEAAIRFPGLMFGLLGAVSAGIVGWRMFGGLVGLLAGMFYATLVLPTALAQAAMGDVALVPWVSLAVLLFWESDRAATRRAAAGCTLGVGVLLGLACLTKGLAGVALVGVAYGCYLLVARRLTIAPCVRAIGALAVAALVASPWYIAMEMHNPGYNYYYFIERHLLGYATGTQHHGQQPWWYYLPVLLGGGLPWIAYLPAAARDAWARRKGADRRRCSGAAVLLWCWLIGGTLFFSAAHSKLATYVWPVFPPVAVLAAVAWVRLLEGSLSEGAGRMLAGTFWLSCIAGTLALPAGMILVQLEFAVRFGWAVWVAAVPAAALSLLPLGFWIAGRVRVAVSAAMLAVAVQFAVVMAVVLPPVAAAHSARDLADHFNRLGRLPPQLLLAEERVGSIVFYFDRDLRADLEAGRLRYIGPTERPQPRPGALIALAERQVGRFGRYCDLTGVTYERVGRYRVYDADKLAPRLSAVSGRGYTTQTRYAQSYAPES